MLFLKPYVEASQRSHAEVVAHPNHAALQQTVAATRALAGRLKMSLKVVLAPTKEEIYRWVLEKREPWSTPAESSGLATALGKICADAGLEFLDLKPSFVAESKALFARSGGLLWWYDDTHWNGAGHDLAASVIQRELLAPRVR
jgi:hypothetical protein